MTNGWPWGRSQHRTILILDMEGYGSRDRDDAIRIRLRARLRELMTKALVGAGIDDERHTAQSTGDGLLVTVDPSVGKPRVLGLVVDDLAAGLLTPDCTRGGEAGPAAARAWRLNAS